MSRVEFIAPTKRRKMTKPRAAKIFLERNGICFICTNQIRQGQEWFIEHPEAVNLGGSDNDADLWPAHTKCKPGKDAVDAAKIADRNTAITKGYAGKSRTSRPMPGSKASGWKRKMNGQTERR